MNIRRPLCRAAAVSVCVGFAATIGAAQAETQGTGTGIVRPTLEVVNLSGNAVREVPVTFGQPFRAGEIPEGDTVDAYLGDKAIPTQANIKARNADGSARHGIFTLLLPKLAGHQSLPIALRAVPMNHDNSDQKPITIAELLKTRFDASIKVRMSGTVWHLDARQLLSEAADGKTCKPYGRQCNIWLSGPLVSEWIVGGPVLDDKGQPQAHLAVDFAIRAYGPLPITRVRVDVIVENDWAYVPGPHNLTYDASIEVGGRVAYRIRDLEHYRQARWHKVLWWGRSDPLYARLNSAYLQTSRAVPRYEDVKPSERLLGKVRQSCAPMQRCDQSKDMSTVGAQAGIGPLPRWTSVYVIDPSYRAFRWMLADSDALGSYGVHYRERLTGQPVSVQAHPCATLFGPPGVTRCPVAPHADDYFPHCKAQCKSPLVANEPHHPSPAYVAYLVTGDWYYLEELKFWADWVVFQQNPKYRDYRTGLIVRSPLRGQGWALRTLGYAAYILPDKDPFKSYFNQVVENNLDWYNRRYTDNPDANKLHIITTGDAMNYPNHGHPKTGIATWQASFFTWAVGNLKDLGFKGAGKLLDWVAKYQVGLMTSPHFCWVVASKYQLQVRDTKRSPFYGSLREVYVKNFPQLKGVPCASDEMAVLLGKRHGRHHFPDAMVGGPRSPTGYPANFQIGLAAAADSDVPEARKAWEIFQGSAVRPEYSDAPQFAVVPRH